MAGAPAFRALPQEAQLAAYELWHTAGVPAELVQSASLSGLADVLGLGAHSERALELVLELGACERPGDPMLLVYDVSSGTLMWDWIWSYRFGQGVTWWDTAADRLVLALPLRRTRESCGVVGWLPLVYALWFAGAVVKRGQNYRAWARRIQLRLGCAEVRFEKLTACTLCDISAWSRPQLESLRARIRLAYLEQYKAIKTRPRKRGRPRKDGSSWPALIVPRAKQTAHATESPPNAPAGREIYSEDPEMQKHFESIRDNLGGPDGPGNSGYEMAAKGR